MWKHRAQLQEYHVAALLTTQGMRSNQELGCAYGTVMAMICLRIPDNLQQRHRPSGHRAFRKLWGNVLKASTAAHLNGFHAQPELSLYLLAYRAGS